MKRLLKWGCLGTLALLALGVIIPLISPTTEPGASTPPDPAPDLAVLANTATPVSLENTDRTETLEQQSAQIHSPTPEATPTTKIESGIRDGTYVVGQDIQPGTYRSQGMGMCYWARLSGFSGELDDIIVNGNNAPEIITIGADDTGFETHGCGNWVPLEATAPESPSSEFGDGTYRIGMHVLPGTYRSDAQGLCYWARLSGFSGEIDDVIANGNNAPEIVTINAGDVGFTTSHCGRWVPVELTAPDSPSTNFGDGTYRVGIHIAPGTYQADGQGLCYWARLSDYTHELNGIITNGNDPTIITIDPSDSGFTTFGCGMWSMK